LTLRTAYDLPCLLVHVASVFSQFILLLGQDFCKSASKLPIIPRTHVFCIDISQYLDMIKKVLPILKMPFALTFSILQILYIYEHKGDQNKEYGCAEQ
jgi:hypothetical protein